MQNRSQLFFGGVLITLGAMFLASNVLNINLWQFFFPTLLILIGVSIILRSQNRNPEVVHRDKLFGDLDVVISGQPRSEDMWVGIGDVGLDLSTALFPAGVTTYRVSGFIGDIDVTVPAGVG